MFPGCRSVCRRELTLPALSAMPIRSSYPATNDIRLKNDTSSPEQLGMNGLRARPEPKEADCHRFKQGGDVPPVGAGFASSLARDAREQMAVWIHVALRERPTRNAYWPRKLSSTHPLLRLNYLTSHGLAIAALGAFRIILKSRESIHSNSIKPSSVRPSTADVELSTFPRNAASISLQDCSASSMNRLVTLRNK